MSITEFIKKIALLDLIGDHKTYYYKYYEHNSWKFFRDNFPLQVIKHDLAPGILSKYLMNVCEECKENIQGFVDEIDEDGYHHFIAPMKCFVAEYWQKTNSTQITFNENVVEELELKKSTYLYKKRYWRYYLSLKDLDVRTQLYTDVTHWKKNEKPVDDIAYKTIVKYLEKFEEHIKYILNFEDPDICKIQLRSNNMYINVEPVDVTVHYDTIIIDLKAGVGLLFMRVMMCIKKEILNLNGELNTIMKMKKKL